MTENVPISPDARAQVPTAASILARTPEGRWAMRAVYLETLLEKPERTPAEERMVAQHIKAFDTHVAALELVEAREAARAAEREVEREAARGR